MYLGSRLRKKVLASRTRSSGSVRDFVTAKVRFGSVRFGFSLHWSSSSVRIRFYSHLYPEPCSRPHFPPYLRVRTAVTSPIVDFWWSDIAVARWYRSTKLTYVGPG